MIVEAPVPLSMSVDLRGQPLANRKKFALGDELVHVADIDAAVVRELRRCGRPEQVRGKVPERAHAPMDILEAALGIGRDFQAAKQALEVRIPPAGQVRDVEPALDEIPFDLVPENDVKRVRQLVRLDSD